MSSNNPKVSVIAPCFNHENYVEDFIISVLGQYDQNYNVFDDCELIIVDDASSDSSVEKIKKYNDPRIKLIEHKYNKGVNAPLNTAFENSSGKYIVFASADDQLELNHFQYSTKFLDEHPDINVLYCRFNPIGNDNGLDNVFSRLADENLNRFKLLGELFSFNNRIASGGMVVRREAIQKIHPLNNSIVQTQDFQMHIKLLFDNNYYATKERLYKYRIATPENSGISLYTKNNVVRGLMEMESFLNIYLEKIDNIELLEKVFGDRIFKYGEPTDETIPYFLAKLALEIPTFGSRMWGYKTIMKFIDDKDNFDLLNKLYGFNFKQFMDFAQLMN